MGKKLTISGPPAYQQALCMALGLYTDAAYPPGGSECGQVARAALLDALAQLETGFASPAGEAQVSRRLRAHMKAAVSWYCQQTGNQALLACLEKMAQGQIVSDEDAEKGCEG